MKQALRAVFVVIITCFSILEAGRYIPPVFPTAEIIPEIQNHRNYKLLPDKCGYGSGGADDPYDNGPTDDDFEPNFHETNKRVRRMLNGELTQRYQYPWMVAFYSERRGRLFGNFIQKFICAGSILNSYTILTDARCCINLKNEESEEKPYFDLYTNIAQVGPWDIKNTNRPANVACIFHRKCLAYPNTCIESKPHKTDDKWLHEPCLKYPQNHRISSYTIHEQYNPDDLTRQNDICLVHVIVPIELEVPGRGLVKPICLPIYKHFTEKTFDEVTIAGWGDEWDFGDWARYLKKSYVPVMNNKLCKNWRPQLNEELQFCAGGRKKDVNLTIVRGCARDDGSPATTTSQFANRFSTIHHDYILGIDSYGSDDYCTLPEPRVYTKVTSYMQWILDHLVPPPYVKTDREEILYCCI